MLVIIFLLRVNVLFFCDHSAINNSLETVAILLNEQNVMMIKQWIIINVKNRSHELFRNKSRPRTKPSSSIKLSHAYERKSDSFCHKSSTIGTLVHRVKWGDLVIQKFFFAFSYFYPFYSNIMKVLWA